MTFPPGFLEDGYKMLLKRFPRMNKDFLLAIMEVTLSSACWKVYTVDEYSALAPNIWIQAILSSGAGKTLPIDHFLTLILEALEKKIETDKEVYVLHLSDYTKEAIVKFFSNKSVRKYGKKKDKNKKEKKVIYTYGVLCKDESSMFLNAILHKSYMADIVGVESKIYDGKLWRKITTSRGLEEVPKCFKANISATTPTIYNLMKEDGFIQGGWNRYDMIVGNPLTPEEIEMLKEEFFFSANLENREQLENFEQIPFDYADELFKIVNGDNIYIRFDDEANLLWRQYEYETKKEATALDYKNLRKGYLERQAEKVLKRAMLYTVSKELYRLEHLKSENIPVFGEIKKERSLLCEADTMKLAIKNQKALYEYWLKMLEERGRSPPKSDLRTNEAERTWFAEACIRLTKEHGTFSRKLLIEATQWNSCDRRLMENIESARVEDKLKSFSDDESRGICAIHKAENDMAWFEAQKIHPSFKNPPYMYKWKGVDKN